MSLQINNQERKTYVVLGAPHSGTSLIAKGLHDAGIFMGHRFDPKNYEDLEIIEINKEILNSCDGKIFRPPEKRSAMDFSYAINRIFEDRRSHSHLWGFKDPRTSLVMDHYLSHLEDDCYLICIFRRPSRVAQSLSSRFNFNFENMKRVASNYNARILKAIRKFCNE